MRSWATLRALHVLARRTAAPLRKRRSRFGLYLVTGERSGGVPARGCPRPRPTKGDPRRPEQPSLLALPRRRELLVGRQAGGALSAELTRTGCENVVRQLTLKRAKPTLSGGTNPKKGETNPNIPEDYPVVGHAKLATITAGAPASSLECDACRVPLGARTCILVVCAILG